MKYIWEVDDIKVGMHIIRQSSPVGSKDMGFASTVTYQICWYGEAEKRRYYLSSVTDGMMFGKYKNKEEIVNKFNEDSEGYRILSKQVHIKIIEDIRSFDK